MSEIGGKKKIIALDKHIHGRTDSEENAKKEGEKGEEEEKAK